MGLSSRSPTHAILFGLAALGPNLFSVLVDECLFTWPMCLYVALELAVRECTPAEPQRTGWRPRLAIAAFLLVCGLYFAACRAVGMPIGWYFLMGLVAATSFAIASAYLRPPARVLADVSFVAGFSGFSCGERSSCGCGRRCRKEHSGIMNRL